MSRYQEILDAIQKAKVDAFRAEDGIASVHIDYMGRELMIQYNASPSLGGMVACDGIKPKLRNVTIFDCTDAKYPKLPIVVTDKYMGPV